MDLHSILVIDRVFVVFMGLEVENEELDLIWQRELLFGGGGEFIVRRRNLQYVYSIDLTGIAFQNFRT